MKIKTRRTKKTRTNKILNGSGEPKIQTIIGKIREWPSFTHSDLEVLEEHEILDYAESIQFYWDKLNYAKENLIKSQKLGWSQGEELSAVTRWNPQNWVDGAPGLSKKPMELICHHFNEVGKLIYELNEYVKDNIISYDGDKFHDENCEYDNCKCVEPDVPFLYKDTYRKLISWIQNKKRYYNNYLSWFYRQQPWNDADCRDFGFEEGTADDYKFQDTYGGNRRKSYRTKKYVSKRK